MADNPLYPGYKPTGKEGPIYPGYYPGTPMSRVPRNPNLAGKFNFDFSSVNEFLNTLQFEFSNGSNMPSWVRERVIDDFKQSLKASIESAGVDVERLDDYDPEALPGATGISINMDPLEWIKDPRKLADKTLRSWKESILWKGNNILDWPDLENRVRENLWRQVISEKPDFSRVVGGDDSALAVDRYFAKGGAKLAEQTAEMVLRRTGHSYDLTPSNGTNPLALITGDYTASMGKKQLYTWDGVSRNAGDGKPKLEKVEQSAEETLQGKLATVGKHVIGFESGQATGFKRDLKHDEFLRGVVDTVDYEVHNDKIFNRGLENATSGLSALEAAKVKDRWLATRGSFRSRKDIADKMGDINYGWMVGPGATTAALNRAIIDGVSIDVDTDYGININVLAKVQKTESAIDGALAHLDEQLYTSKDICDATGKVVGKSTTGILGIYDKEEAERLGKALQPYKEHLVQLKTEMNKLSTLLDKINKEDPNFGNVTDALKSLADDPSAKVQTALKISAGDRARIAGSMRKIDSLMKGGYAGKGVAGGDLLVSGYERTLLRELGGELTGRTGIGGLTKEMESNGVSLFSTRLKAYVSRLGYERDVLAIDEVLDQWARGKFMETYVWKRITNYLTGATPSYYSKNILSKLAFLGLKIDNDRDFDRILSKFGPLRSLNRFGKSANDPNAPGKLFGNYFKVKYNQETAGTIQTFTINLYGGIHFSGIQSLNDLWKTGHWNHEAIAYMMANIGPNGFNDPAFTQQILKILGTDKLPLPEGLNLDDFGVRMLALKKYVSDQASLQKLTGLNTNDARFWLWLSNTLSKRGGKTGYIDITSKYAGLLQKLWQQLNIIQAKILEKVGKYLAPIVYLKTLIAEAVSEAIIKVLDSLAAGASAGIGALITETLGRVLKPIIRFVVRKTMDFAELLFKGILGGDFFLVFREMEKFAMAMIKTIGIIVGIPFIIMLTLTMLFGGFAASTYSPIDPTATQSSVDPGPGPGEVRTECTTIPPDGDLADLDPGETELVQTAYGYVADLDPGFWCMWNHQPDFPQFWSQVEFNRNPFPPGNWADPYALFWCTYLVIESYRATGIPIDPALGGAHTMGVFFGYDQTHMERSKNEGHWRFISNRDIHGNVCSGTGCGTHDYDVEPGDVVFYHVLNSGRTSCTDNISRICHVAMVHSADATKVETIHSNSGLKRWTHERNSGGGVLGNEYFEVIGFGRYVEEE